MTTNAIHCKRSVGLPLTLTALFALGELVSTAIPTVYIHAAASVPSLDHVIEIVMENKTYEQITSTDKSDAPYINGTLIPSGALATSYFGDTNPSLPNYFALTYGQDFSNNPVVQNDGPPGSQAGEFQTNASSIANSLETAGKTWKAYLEGMPSDCYPSNDLAANYYVHHNPFAYSTVLPSCTSDDVPFSQFTTDLNNGTLPAFSFVVPNRIDDMHTGTSTAAEIQNGDAWLSSEIPSIQASSTFQNTNTLVIVTWDEGTKYPVDNHVVTVFLGNSSLIQTGSRDNTTYTNGHYSLLHTIESGLGIGTLTANDANAPTLASMFFPPTQPVLSSFSPTSGPVGASVAISGMALLDTSSVTFNGVSASFSVQSDTLVNATVPSGASTGPIGITTANGSVTSSTNFTVFTSSNNPPVVTSFTPPSGPVGTQVNVSGQYFTGATSVSFNGTNATSFTVQNDTALTALVPVSATSGVISVSTPNGSGSSSSNFTVTTSPPPANNNVVEDDFTRANQAGFGTSTNTDGIANHPWTNSVATNRGASINSNAGEFVYTGNTTGRVYNGWIGSKTSGNVDVLARVAFADVGSPQFRIFADNTSNGNYAAELDTAANVLHVYYKNGSGRKSTIGTDYAFTFVTNMRYWVRLDVNNGVVSARIWQDGSAEPTSWQVSSSDIHLTSGTEGAGFSWAVAPSGSGGINLNAFAVAPNGNLAVAPDSGSGGS